MEKFLFLDGSLCPCRVGSIGQNGEMVELEAVDKPLSGFFYAVEELFRRQKISWDDISAFLVSAGPGNLTGLRSAKMFVDTALAIRMGRPVYAFCGLELGAQWICESQQLKNFSLLAPISKQRSAIISVTNGTVGKIHHGKTDEFAAAGPLFAMGTGFAAPTQLRATPPPMEFIAKKLAEMQPAKTFEPITFH
ncbi:MAG: hypothetical protein LBB38_03145 [Puniceicoccales bacterium]|jgi:tRNA A37 threonylcarbamoyladenosine modification protein TsaB|nr:hypothetical protein [Puniceicoccales bacterium]